MKKRLLFSIITIFSFFATFADSFTDILQDLAKQTACIGQYSATQAGGGWNDDPHDYYTPPMMAERFKQMSGNQTKTDTFYGICFNYAQAAYDDITRYKSTYNEKGMYETSWYIASAGPNGNSIDLYDPCTKEQATVIKNGVYVKRNTTFNYKTHKMLNGTRATNHAWLLIQRNDGVWFWIDPTWTDNLGYVVYGYVSNGEEIQLRPDEKYCINYPDYLKDLQLPPQWGKQLAPSTSKTTTASSNTTSSLSSTNNSNRDPSSGGSSSTTSSSSSSRSSSTYNPSSGSSLSNRNPVFAYICLGYTGSLRKFKSSGSSNPIPNFFEDLDGIEFSIDTYAKKSEQFAIFSFDLLGSSYLLGFNWGYGLSFFFQPYFGGAIGFKISDNDGISWKIDGGIRIPISAFCIRADISYSDILGFGVTIAMGMDISFL